MGADIKIIGKAVVINGVPYLRGANVDATDLRAGASFVCAALAAEGTTTLGGIEYIDRGYQKLDETLSNLGADIRRIGCGYKEMPHRVKGEISAVLL